MKDLFAKCDSQKCASWALLVLRIAMAIIFIYHGYGKLFGAPGMTGFTGMVGNLGFPLPSVFAYIAALAEFIGGIALLLGVWTRLAASLIGVNMIVAIIMVKKFALPMIDADLALLAISLTLVLMGPGMYSISALTNKTRTVAAPAIA